MSGTGTGCVGCADGKGVGFDFTMAFQPVVDIFTRRIYAYEALVRGPNGEGAGQVLAQVTAENRYAFDQACRVKAIELAAELGMAKGAARLSINFMPNAVYEPKACIRATLAAAARAGFPLDRISFEITEDERVRDHVHLNGIIDEYRRHGFLVALDDFGAGYSGLNLLADMLPDVVKLDMAMVRGIDANPSRRIITLGMIGVCRELGIQVVAEGVETRSELEVLAVAGVRYVQGFLFAKPSLARLAADSEIDFG